MEVHGRTRGYVLTRASSVGKFYKKFKVSKKLHCSIAREASKIHKPQKSDRQPRRFSLIDSVHSMIIFKKLNSSPNFKRIINLFRCANNHMDETARNLVVLFRSIRSIGSLLVIGAWDSKRRAIKDQVTVNSIKFVNLINFA